MPRNLLCGVLGSEIFCSQKKNAWSHFTIAQPSLSSPHFGFTLMNVYRNTGYSKAIVPRTGWYSALNKNNIFVRY